MAAPTVTITVPTSDPTWTTNDITVALAGTASSDVGLDYVYYVSDRGANGLCTGTSEWSCNVLLQSGQNVITITAYDTSAGQGTDVLTVNGTDKRTMFRP